MTSDRSEHLDKLKLDLDAATASALQSGLKVVDVILAMLMVADSLSEAGEASGADLSRLSGVVPTLEGH
jgi:hypothetical protein